MTELDRIKERGNIRVALITTPPLYFPNETLIRGYDYEIIADYAKSIGVDLEITRASTINEISTLLKQGKVHIGIAGSAPIYPDENISSNIPYNNDDWYVIGHRQDDLPKSLEEITSSTIVVAKGSTPALVLEDIKAEKTNLFWLELPDSNTRQILDQVNKGNFKLSLISADIFTYYRYLFTDVRIAFTLPKTYSSHWLTHKNKKDTSLTESISGFWASYKNTGKPEKKHDNYFNHLKDFNYVDTTYYLMRIENNLEDYGHHFHKAAVDNEFDARFLKAVSYQESHWNPLARSPTGVRGLMMLTNETAKRVGVTDRLDPEQSVMGGAKYLNILKASIAEQIEEPDRSWMTLAAYNVGLGHLEDARIITQKQGDDPDSWIDVEKHLPKLSKEEWHVQTKYGYARGHEPVKFVKRIRRYYDILRLYQQEEILEKLDNPLDLDNLQINSPVF